MENEKEKESRVGDQECGCGNGHDLQFNIKGVIWGKPSWRRLTLEGKVGS